MAPDYKNPYYWASILAPPIIICFGVVFAATIGVKEGVKRGVYESMRDIEESGFIETCTKQLLNGANKYIRETDFIGQLSNQIIAGMKILKPNFSLTDSK